MKKIISLIISLFVVVAFIFDVPAQTNRNGRSKKFRQFSKKADGKKTFPSTVAVAQPEVLPTPVPAMTAPLDEIVDETVSVPQSSQLEISGDVQSGNVIVNVSSNGNAVVKIGLSPRGVAVIDFPVSDPVYRIHPGDEHFVTVGCTAREENGKCGNSPTDAIILRPGKNFHSLGSEDSAATVVTVQRVSGIVVSFIVVPVKNIAQNANYVVVRYNLNDVIASRQNAGLAVNLQPGVIKLPPLGNPVQETQPNPNEAEFLNISSSATQPLNSQTTEETLQMAVIAELERVAADSSGLRFGKPIYGLSLARASTGSRTSDVTIEVVAVRNTLTQPLRLVPDQPDLVIENKEKRNASVNIERLNILHTATTVEADDVLLPGQIYYFAFAYTSPILGIKQVLRVSFAQREAADAPASLELGGFAR